MQGSKLALILASGVLFVLISTIAAENSGFEFDADSVLPTADSSKPPTHVLKRGEGLFPSPTRRQDDPSHPFGGSSRPGGGGGRNPLMSFMGRLSRLPLFSRGPRPSRGPPPSFGQPPRYHSSNSNSNNEVVFPHLPPPGFEDGADGPPEGHGFDGGPPPEGEGQGDFFEDNSQEQGGPDFGQEGEEQMHAPEFHQGPPPSSQSQQLLPNGVDPTVPFFYPDGPGQQQHQPFGPYQFQPSFPPEQAPMGFDLRASAPQVEVVKSQMISYNHHQQPHGNYAQANGGAANNVAVGGSGPDPFLVAPNVPSPSAPPSQSLNGHPNAIPHSHSHLEYTKPNQHGHGGQHGQGGGGIPVVPQSTGPDYFDTAYRLQNQNQNQNRYSPQQNYQHHQQQQHPQQQQLGLNSAVNNYGATFHDIRQQPAAPTQTGTFDPVIGMNHEIQLAASQTLREHLGGLGLGGSLFNQVPSQSGASSPLQSQSHSHSQRARPSTASEPSVQILSQGLKDGNPVFEVLADANAPLFDGQHPFDINKLIAMIEPGAQVDEPPQLSQPS